MSHDEILIRFVQHTCPVNRFEICRLKDNTLIDVARLAQYVNNKRENELVPVLVEKAAWILNSSNRSPSERQWNHLAPLECDRPILLMRQADQSFFLIDGASRILRAKELNRKAIRAFVLDETTVRDHTFDPLADTSQNDLGITINEDLARIWRLTAAEAGTLIQSRPRVATLERATGPANAPGRTGDLTWDDVGDRLYANVLCVETAENPSFQKLGTTAIERAILDTIVRLTSDLLLAYATAYGHGARTVYLASVTGKFEDLLERSPTAEELSLSRKMTSLHPGLVHLPHLKKLMAEVRRLQKEMPASTESDPSGQREATELKESRREASFRETESRILSQLSVLGVTYYRAKELSHHGPLLTRDAKRVAAMDRTMIETFEAGRKRLPPPTDLLVASNATGVNMTHLWSQIAFLHAPMEWAVAAELLRRGADVAISPAMASSRLAAKAVEAAGQRNGYSELWRLVDDCCDTILPWQHWQAYCFKAALRNEPVTIERS